MVNQVTPILSVGTTEVVGEGPFFTVDGETLLGFTLGEEGTLQITAALYNCDDTLLAFIEENEWVSGDVNTWDIQFQFQRLTIQDVARSIVLDLDARGSVTNLRCEIWRGGRRIELSANGIHVDGSEAPNIAHLCLVGGRIDCFSDERDMLLDSNYPGRLGIISDSDRERRIEKGLARWAELSESTN